MKRQTEKKIDEGRERGYLGAAEPARPPTICKPRGGRVACSYLHIVGEGCGGRMKGKGEGGEDFHVSFPPQLHVKSRKGKDDLDFLASFAHGGTRVGAFSL